MSTAYYSQFIKQVLGKCVPADTRCNDQSLNLLQAHTASVCCIPAPGAARRAVVRRSHGAYAARQPKHWLKQSSVVT